MALLSGIACWLWLLPQLAGDPRPPAAAANAPLLLREVEEADIAGALSTMNLTEAAQARAERRDCAMRLAWVSLRRGNGGGPETVRLRSGDYISPPIPLPETPVRVAIFYPAPYETGQGVITVLDAHAGLTVALSPPWRIPENTPAAGRLVKWTPSEACKRP